MTDWREAKGWLYNNPNHLTLLRMDKSHNHNGCQMSLSVGQNNTIVALQNFDSVPTFTASILQIQVTLSSTNPHKGSPMCGPVAQKWYFDMQTQGREEAQLKD